jgi:hypothetical protein
MAACNAPRDPARVLPELNRWGTVFASSQSARNRTRSGACMMDTSCAPRPRESCSMGGSLKKRGPSPMVGRSYHGPPPSNQGLCSDPASLSAGCIFSPLCFPAPLTSAEYNKWDSSTLAVSDVDPARAQLRRIYGGPSRLRRVPARFAAFQHVCLIDRATCIRRAASSAGPLASSFGGLNHLPGLSSHPLTDHFFFWLIFILYSPFPRSMFTHTATFLGVYSICLHHTYMFCFCQPFNSWVFLSSLSYMHPYVLSIWRTIQLI